jgi:hypothetical protein
MRGAQRGARVKEGAQGITRAVTGSNEALAKQRVKVISRELFADHRGGEGDCLYYMSGAWILSSPSQRCG